MSIRKPIIPSTVLTFAGAQVPIVAPSFAETVAIPLTHDWGPLGADAAGSSGLGGGVQLVTSFPQFTAMFGDSDTPGRTAVAGAFDGQGLPGSGGAGGVYVYRMGSAAAAATATVNNVGATPGGALTLTALYKGSRGDRLSYAVAPDPGNAANDRLQILLDGIVVESYSYPRISISTLVNLINSRPSPYVTAALHADGNALAYTTGTKLVGGLDGSGGQDATPGVATLTATDWLNALSAFEFKPFSILAPFDLTDSSIQASLLSWVQTQSAYNRPVVAVIGGQAGEVFATALSRAQAMNDPHMVTVGVGTWHDDLVGKDLSTSQIAPRIAGIIAQRGQMKSLSAAKVSGVHQVGQTGASIDQVASCVSSGIVTFMRTSSADAELRIAAGVTTYTTATNPAVPYEVFRDIRLVRVMDIFIRTLKQWSDDNIVGDGPVGDDSRAAIKGQGRRLINDLLQAGLILPGDDVTIPKPFISVIDPKDPALLDAIPFTFGWQFARTANAVLGEGKIR